MAIRRNPRLKDSTTPMLPINSRSLDQVCTLLTTTNTSTNHITLQITTQTATTMRHSVEAVAANLLSRIINTIITPEHTPICTIHSSILRTMAATSMVHPPGTISHTIKDHNHLCDTTEDMTGIPPTLPHSNMHPISIQRMGCRSTLQMDPTCIQDFKVIK
jgi:hypothetical protein